MTIPATIQARFDRMVERMQVWRDADQADSIMFSRNDIVTLLEGIKDARARVSEMRAADAARRG
jgi:hypothetical protein